MDDVSCFRDFVVREKHLGVIKFFIDNGANYHELLTGERLEFIVNVGRGDSVHIVNRIEKQKELEVILDSVDNNIRMLEDAKEDIKRYLEDQETPPYIKLSAIAILVDSYNRNEGIIGRDELVRLMRFAQFNYRFFNDNRLKSARTFALETLVVDHRGRTVIQEAPKLCRKADFAAEIVAKKFCFGVATDRRKRPIAESLALLNNGPDSEEKDEFEVFLQEAKKKKNNVLYRAAVNAAIDTERLQKAPGENGSQLFIPEISAEIIKYLGADTESQERKKLFLRDPENKIRKICE